MSSQSIQQIAADAVADLDMDALGEIKKIITVTVEGVLEPEDVAKLLDRPQVEPGGRQQPEDLSKVREKHHSVARLLASGLNQRTVAAITGYTESYLSVMLNNPAMQDLIAHYRSGHNLAAERIGERLKSIGMTAIEQLAERLETPGDNPLDANELIQLAKLGLDRSGHGPSQHHKVDVETHIIDHAALKAANRAALEGSQELLLPPTPRRIGPAE